MLASLLSRPTQRAVHNLGLRNVHVAVLGASGGIGQPLSLLLKLNPKVSELSLFDVVNTVGVAADISHVNSKAKVRGFVGNEQLQDALRGAKVVVIPAGVPRKPGMTRDDLFNTNASIVASLAQACATTCPDAMFLIISNPVNSTVPIFAEVLKKNGVYNPRHLFGVTTLDVCRANTFVSENQGQDVYQTNVPVIGGHAGTTIIPLLSQLKGAKFSDEDIQKLTHRIQFGGDEVVQAKGQGSATLSMAHAAAEFTGQLLRALEGEKNIVECTFTENNVTDSPFFSTPTRLGTDGVEEVLPFGPLSAVEQKNFDEMLPTLKEQVAKGVNFVKHNT